MSSQGVVLAVLVGVVIGMTVPTSMKDAKKRVKKAKNFVETLQEEGSKKVRGDSCEKDDSSAMSEQYECTIEMFDETTSLRQNINSLISTQQKLAIANHTESEVANLIYKSALSIPELQKYGSVLKTNARKVASAARC